MLTEILKNSNSAANHIEITLSSILIGVIIIKILLRIIFSTIYENSKEPFVIKNNNPSHIDYEQISNKYFQYFSLLAPKLSKNVNCNKVRHYDLEKK